MRIKIHWHFTIRVIIEANSPLHVLHVNENKSLISIIITAVLLGTKVLVSTVVCSTGYAKNLNCATSTTCTRVLY